MKFFAFFALFIMLPLMAQDSTQPTEIPTETLLKKIGDSYRNHNYAESIALAELGCNQGNSIACGALGNLYSSELDAMRNFKDLQKAAHAYFKACEGRIAAACFYLGVFHANGQGVQQNYGSARGFFARACELGDADACDAMGNFYANANRDIMPQQDYAQAANFYRKSCESSRAPSCFKLATLYRIGQGVKADFAMAKKFYGKSCQLGDPQGCEAWWSMENVSK
ncbi:MAG: sel1 repeat family protein [Helicobacter sp.]|nr:sel1 repeat family protein [Helicobacter sp.]